MRTLLRGGIIVDGTGSRPAYQGDVYILNDIIEKITPWNQNQAPQQQANDKMIDCTGKFITPGWIDQHCHYDGQVTWDPFLSPSASCGVTTMIMGNCGIGFAPVRQSRKEREFLLHLVESVEDIPGAALNVGIDWSWETFPQYLDKLDSLNLAADVGVMIGHAPLRAYVLGERASLSDRPGGPANDIITEDEINQMEEVVREAVAHGALGFSTSRIILHRDKSGNLTPGSLAQEAEMLALGRGVGLGGGGIFEGAFDFATYDDIPRNKMDKSKIRIHGEREWYWMTEIAKNYGVKFSFATSGERMRQMREFNEAQGENLMYGQVLIRPQGLLLSINSKLNPFRYTPTFRKLKEQGKHMHLPTLRDAKVKNAIISEATKMLKENDTLGQIFKRVMGPLGQTYKWTRSYEPKPEDSVLATAKRLGLPEHVVLYNWMTEKRENEGNGLYPIIWRPMFTPDPSLEWTRKQFVEHYNALPGVADGGAHGTVLTDATANTSMLMWYCRDRTEDFGPKIGLEHAVMKMTSAIADLYFMEDRGRILSGMKADINVIDMDKLNIHPPKYVDDLPKHATRWLQEVEGYAYTLKNGVITFIDGQATGALPGGLVRNPKAIQRNKAKSIPSLTPWKELLSNQICLFGEVDTTNSNRDIGSALGQDEIGGSSLGRMLDVLDDDNNSRAKM
eukprot:g3977.t1